jgi:hypothetical protein
MVLVPWSILTMDSVATIRLLKTFSSILIEKLPIKYVRYHLFLCYLLQRDLSILGIDSHLLLTLVMGRLLLSQATTTFTRTISFATMDPICALITTTEAPITSYSITSKCMVDTNQTLGDMTSSLMDLSTLIHKFTKVCFLH